MKNKINDGVNQNRFMLNKVDILWYTQRIALLNFF